MFARLLRLFKVESMIKPDLVQGELPTTKQAYKDVLQIALPSIMELVLISLINSCLLYTSPSPRDRERSRMPSAA